MPRYLSSNRSVPCRRNRPGGRRPLPFLVALLLVVACLAPTATFAQDSRDGRQIAQRARTSPFEPPTEDTFVADSGPGLDTGCTFNDDPEHPLVITVMIDQAVGEVDGSGFLVDPAALVSQGVVPATVEVIIPAFDVDVAGSPPPESDEVVFNGESLGFLDGDDGIWKLNSFQVDISKIKFPAPGGGGSAGNEVQINIDTLSSGRWCTQIDWVALVIPIRLPISVKLEPTIGNDVVPNGGTSAIDVIHEQSFDADCNLTDVIGPYDDYPFSGSMSAGSARLATTLETCPAGDLMDKEIEVEWTIDGTSLTGVSSWEGPTGNIDVTMPSEIGAYDVELVFTVDGDEGPTVNRKLFVTKGSPLCSIEPGLSSGCATLFVKYYELATDWASGTSSEADILPALLSGLYGYGGANWLYGYDFGSVPFCNWDQLAADPLVCNYSDCHRFGEVFTQMAAILGVGGLSMVIPEGTAGAGFLTTGAPSLDAAFPGNARPFGTATFDRYYFINHNLRLKAGTYYDATFNGRYSSPSDFIAANRTGGTASDVNGPYYVTFEGWKIYPFRGPHAYDSWGNNEYTMPTSPVTAPPPTGAPMGQELVRRATGASFGAASFDTLDADGDGLAEALRAELEVNVAIGAQYWIFGTLQKDGALIANRSSYFRSQDVSAQLDAGPGTHTVTLDFSGEQIFRSGEDGPYEMVLFLLSPTGFEPGSFATPAYDHTLFGELPGSLQGVSESAVDTDGDGVFEAIEVYVQVWVRTATPLQVRGNLSKGAASLADAGALTDTVPGLQEVVLTFPGGALNRSGEDGPYDGTINLTDAAGNTLESLTFTTDPYGSGSFGTLLEPDGPLADQGIDTNGNGLFDLLQVDLAAQLAEGGNYLVTGILRSPGGGAVYVDASLAAPAGPVSLSFPFPGPHIHALGMNGPYTVDLVVRDASTLAQLDALTAGVTGSYAFTDFDSFDSTNDPIVLTGSSADFGIDTDGNGLYNLLQVNVEMALQRSGVYDYGARLVDADGTEIGFYTRRAFFSAGLAQVPFLFDGEAIGNNGADGPYFVKGLLMFGASGANLVAVDVAETAAYLADEFEGGDAQPPVITVPAEPTVLFPPNHKIVTFDAASFVVSVTDDVDDMVSAADVVVSRVSSDEADDVGAGGDGSTAGDVVIQPGCHSVGLRAERQGKGNGRVYTVELAVSDAAGNVGTAVHTVVVPASLGGKPAVDDGPAFTVEGCSP